jgi:hypothetical protein
MKTQLTGELQAETNQNTTINVDTNFNFDQWAVQVRQQMIAALRRRGVR